MRLSKGMWNRLPPELLIEIGPIGVYKDFKDVRQGRIQDFRKEGGGGGGGSG